MRRCNNCFEIIDESFQFCPNCGYRDGNPPEEAYFLYPGVVLQGRYSIGEVIGVGGFGITYKAFDNTLGSVIAVKEFYPSGIVNRNLGTNDIIIYAKKREQEFYFFKERFLDEARNMAKFNSEQNIVNVFEFFEENNTAYIAMEFLEGQGLNKYLHENNDLVEVDFAVKIAEEIAGALGKLHSIGIIHRDISPDNIFLCNDGKIKLIDFGAARFSRDENRQLTVILKPGFAPPEQYEQINKQGPWTDIYALGATLYYIMTGQCPEESTNRKINDTLIFPNKINPNIPEYLSNTIMKAMAIDLSLRFKNVNEFLAALHQEKTIVPVADEKKKRSKKRNIGVASVAILAAVGITVAAIALGREKNQNTLPDSEITIWYCKSSIAEDEILDSQNIDSYNESLNDAELKAYNEIIEAFCADDMYANVKINVYGFEEKDYIYKLEHNDELPNIYEYIGVDSTLPHISLKDEVYKSNEIAECSLLRQAEAYYGSSDYLPLGFTAPLVFERRSNDDFSGGKVSSIKDIADDRGFATDYRGMSDTFSDAGSYYDSSAYDMFSKNTNGFYGTQSSNYWKMETAMPAQYAVLPCDSSEIHCVYSNVWTTNKINRDEDKAAARFLNYMITNQAQDILYLENRNESFPINDETLESYVGVHDKFDGFFDNKENYKFEKEEE